MAKPHRGSNIRELFAHGRGECPVCKRQGVKILYEQEAEGQKFKICKTCRAAIRNGTKKLPVVAVAKAPEPAPAPAKAAAPVAEAAPAAAPAAPTATAPAEETAAAAAAE